MPERIRGVINWGLVLLHRASDPVVKTPPPVNLPLYAVHHQFARAYDNRDLSAARAIWDSTHFAPVNSQELAELAEVNADVGREEAVPMAMQLRRAHLAESEAILGRLRMREGKYDEAAAHIYNSYVAYRTDPWPTADLMGTELRRRHRAGPAQPGHGRRDVRSAR